MEADFSTDVCGKWILAGEHAVLRGSGALVFPLESNRIRLQHFAVNMPLTWKFAGEFGRELEFLFRGVLAKACELLSLDRSQMHGELFVTSNIPVGAGMGASAALCVALTRWLIHLGHVSESEGYDFSRGLEDLFHGESSGVDIAVALSQKPLYFERSGVRRALELTWKPHFYLSYSGKRGVTQECVNQVKNMFLTDPQKAGILDRRMAAATQESLTALTDPLALDRFSKDHFSKLCRAIEQAQSCFEDWGLVEGTPARHIDLLRKLGASAVKMTGSGGGGFVLSLWAEPPTLDIVNGGQLIHGIFHDQPL